MKEKLGNTVMSSIAASEGGLYATKQEIASIKEKVESMDTKLDAILREVKK